MGGSNVKQQPGSDEKSDGFPEINVQRPRLNTIQANLNPTNLAKERQLTANQ